MSTHIVDEEYRGHEVMFIRQDDNLITVDIRIDNFDGEFIAGYTDLATIRDAKNWAFGFINGYHQARGCITTPHDNLRRVTL